MADKLYALNEEDLRHFREMWQAHQRRRENGSQVGIGGELEEGTQASDVYVARTPSVGIPGLQEYTGTSPDEPGSAVCQVYKLAQSQGLGSYKLFKIPGLTKRVFNLTTHDVAGSAWVPIFKTKGGPWIVVGDADEAVTSDDTGTGTEADPDNVTGGGECALAKLNSDDCILATGPDNQKLILRRTGAKTWTSDDELRYPDGTETGTGPGNGSGFLVATWNSTTARMDLSLDGMLLQNCGNGCYTGSWLTGHVNDLDDDEACNGLTFTVCLACHCCPPDGWHGEGWYCVMTGTGTGTASSECEPLYLTEDDVCDVVICSGPYATYALAEAGCGTVELTLCESECGSTFVVPETLYLTIGDNDEEYTFPITYNVPLNKWLGTCTVNADVGGLACGNILAEVLLDCGPPPTYTATVYCHRNSDTDCNDFGDGGGTYVGTLFNTIPGGCTPTRPVDWNEVPVSQVNMAGFCGGGQFDGGTLFIRITETPP